MTTNVLGKNLTARELRGFSVYSKKKVERITELLARFPGDATHLKATGERFPSKAAYKVSFELTVDGDRIFVFEDSHKLHEATDLAFDKLVAQLKHHADRHTGHERRTRSTRRAMKAGGEPDAEPDPGGLTVVDAAADRVALFRELQDILPTLRATVEKDLRKRVLAGEIAPGLLTAEDVVDSVVIDLYERANDMPADLSFSQWAQQRTTYYLKTMLRAEREADDERLSFETLTRSVEAEDRESADGGPREKRIQPINVVA